MAEVKISNVVNSMKTRKMPWLTALTQPAIVYLLAGYVVVYGCFFLVPVFLNSDRVMQFPHYIPTYDPIGGDWRNIRGNLETWISTGKSADVTAIPYPPLGYLLPFPLLFVNAQTSFEIVTAISVLAFVLVVFACPLLFGGGAQTGWAATAFCIVTGLSSYGLQFELERGQFNVLAILLCMLGMYCVHHKPKHVILGYLLFSASIQLKLYPILFVALFVTDWSKHARNLGRLAAVMAFNFALLFVLGFERFLEMLNVLWYHTSGKNLWVGNHSIQSFANLLAGSVPGQKAAWSGLLGDAWSVQVLVLAIVLTSFLVVLLASISRNRAGLDGALLLACTVLALVLPSVSHDYTLALLPGPMAIYLGQLGIDPDPKRQAVTNLLIFVISLAYSSTLFSYVYKPVWLGNNLPMLVIILVTVAVMTRYSEERSANTMVAALS